MTDRDVVSRREVVLAALVEDRLYKRDLVDRLEASRSTVDRAVTELEEADLVERDSGAYAATLAGRLALERYRSYRREVAAIFDTEGLLSALPADCDLPVAPLVGADRRVASEPTPYRPLELLHETIQQAEVYRVLLPTLDDSRHLQLCYEHVVTEGNEATVLVTEELLETLRSEFPRQLAVKANCDPFTIHVGDPPPYGLVLTDQNGERLMTLVVYERDSGSVHGIIQNDAKEAVRWAEHQFETAVENATDVTDAVSADGSDQSTYRGRSTSSGSSELTIPTSGTSTELPVSLEAEGFVRLTPWFFANNAPQDPTTAWRAGLGLSEVQSGYAAERTIDVDGQRRELNGVVLDHLRAGSHCAILGPPGSGKSTLCKQIACEWYRDGDPVYYRESGRGQTFDAVDTLATALREEDDIPLVIIEDAVRSEANAIFDALPEFDGDAVVLLDAREDEWHDSSLGFDPDMAVQRSGVEIVTMPPLSEADYARLIDQFEEIVDRPVDVPIDQLRAEVRDESLSDDEAAPDEVLLLLHRLALYADPHGNDVSMLTDESTTLEGDVAEFHEDLTAIGPVAVDVALLTNLLNAAGVEPDESYIRTVAAEAEATDVGDAIDQLKGRVLFERGSGGYRTVHEEWSVAFLRHYLEAEGEDAAAERICRRLSALLELADDPDRRERIRRACRHGATALQTVAESPGDWTADIVEQVFSFAAQRRPNLTPLLGSVAGPDVTLPAAAPPDVRLRCLYHRGNAYKNTGRLDRAESEFRQIIDSVETDGSMSEGERTEFRALAVAGLGDVATNRGDFGDAKDRMREALELYRQIDDQYGRAHCLDRLGRIAGERGEFDDLDRYCDDAAALAEELGATRIRCRVENSRGLAAWARGNLETAESYFLKSLEHGRSMDSRQDEAFALGNLGLVARERGAFDDAQRYFERALSLRKELEVRPDIALTHWNLGEVARRRGDLEPADQHLREALNLYREVGDEVWIARCRVVLGEIAFDRGDLDAAADHALTAHGTLEEAEEALDRAGALLLLAGVERERGNTADAEARLETARELCGRAESYQGRIWCLTERGRIERDRGEYAAAEESLGRALKLARENDYAYDEAVALEDLGSLEMSRERFESARSYLKGAVSRYRECGAEQNGLEALDALTDACEAVDDASAAERWSVVATQLREAHGAEERPADG